MLTIFSIPKAFNGHTGIIQRNALRSWVSLGPEVEVFVCGDDPGAGDAARECGARYLPDIERNEFGTPILRSAFEQVLRSSRNNLFCYVNGDIVFMRDFVEGMRKIPFRRFLMVGQRWDLDVEEPLDFAVKDWEQALRARVRTSGQLHPPHGIDYFGFRRDAALCALPPFAVGRPGWDNWFIYHARQLGIPVIDATRAITVVHQNHDYGHIPKAAGGTNRGKGWYGPEAEKNWALIGSDDHYFTPEDATHVLTGRGVRRALDSAHLRNRWYRLPMLNPRLASVIGIIDRLTPKFLKKLVRGMLPSS